MVSWFDTVNRFDDPKGAARVARFLSLLDRFPPGHLVDLGAGHGAFSRLAVRRGWRVTAVDARSGRFGTDEDIRWVVQDVRDFDEYDDVDVVACLGLWYHLSADDQTALAAKISPRPVVLDTHVAMPQQSAPEHEVKMSAPVAVNGLQGRFYDESDFHARPTASWGNRESFWPDLPSLEKQFLDAGYETFEVIEPAYTGDRTFFVVGTVGDDATKQRLDDDVATVTALKRPDAAPAATQTSSLLQPLTVPTVTPSAPTATVDPLPGVAAASAQLGRSLVSAARRRGGALRRELDARRARAGR